MPAPVCLFTYNRLAETQKAVKALKANYLASEIELYLFSDGPRKKKDNPLVKNVRDFLHSVEGFKNVEVIETPNNKGLAKSIISGVNKIIQLHGRIIVLEDDLITSPNFLDYMNQALDFYQNSEEVFSISGYTMDLPSLKYYPKDYYLAYRSSSWGWGTWKHQWQDVDWEVSDYNQFKWNIPQQIKFMRGGSDLPHMLNRQMNNNIDSWAIRWCYDQFKKDMYTVFPSISKVISIGFGENATHTKNTNRFDTPLDPGRQRNFTFESNPAIDHKLTKEFRNKFSFKNRLMEKILK